MIVSHHPIQIKPNILQAMEKLCPIDSYLIFDIETTGFHRLKDHIVSVTCLYEAHGTLQISQWFAESPADEKDLLAALKPYFDAKPIHITYNGHSFDIPFLHTKYKYYNISTALNKSKCYDLYRFARKALQLDSYKLKQIEIALGIHREDQISGKDCTLMYEDFLKSHDSRLAELILIHNYEDVLNLAELLVLVDRMDEISLNEFKLVTMDFDNRLWYLQSLKQEGSFLVFSYWSYHENATALKPQSIFLADGGSLILESADSDEQLLECKLAIYTKQLQNTELLCIDTACLDMLSDEDFLPHQIVIKANGLWLQDHLVHMTKCIAKKLIGLS